MNNVVNDPQTKPEVFDEIGKAQEIKMEQLMEELDDVSIMFKEVEKEHDSQLESGCLSCS